MDPGKKPSRSVVFIARGIAAIVSLAGAEGVLWLGGYPDWWAMDHAWQGGATSEYQCDPELGWSAKEGKFDLVWAGLNDIPARITNWSGGRRATAPAEPPASDSRPRVFFFGDSFVQGYGLADEDTLAWIVQRKHPELNVSNLGAGSYGTYQCYLSMKRWVGGPASVIYLLNGYQEVRNAADRSWLRVFKKPPRGCFFPYPVESGGKLEGRKSEGNQVWFLSRRLRTVAMAQDYQQMLESYGRVRSKRKTTETLLAAMNETARSHGGVFTVILVDLAPEDRRNYRDFLSSAGIAAVDFDLSDMRDRRYRLSDGHPNGAMNRLLAERIEPLPAIAARRPQ